jgi:hypothetical protein
MTNNQYPITNDADRKLTGHWSLVIGHWLFMPVALGLGTAGALIAASGLSPLAAADRPALALFAVCLSLPLGAALGSFASDSQAKNVPDPLRLRGNRAIGALLCGALPALFLTGPDPAFFVRTASWCAAGCLLGAALAGLARGVGLLASMGWLSLCGLPFFCDKLGGWSGTAEMYALQGCPWLGFSLDAIGGDPLRRSVIYLGQWSSLGDQPSIGLLTAAELWGAAALALAASLLRAVAPLGARP